MSLKNKKRLHKITSVLLEKEDDFLLLKECTQNLKALFLEACQLNEGDEKNRTDVFLTSGKAIGPTWAAMCVDDILRTKRFICGIDAAIKEKKTKKKPIKLLYVGPGPFATLVMPLITKYTPSEIQFVFFEVNPHTVMYLKKTIAFFSAEKYVSEIKICDATTIKLKNEKDTDILVIECLQRALEQEPQLAIAYNLVHQLNKDVIMIPEDISLSIGLVNSTKQKQQLSDLTIKNKDYITTFKPFLSLNKNTILNDNNNPNLIFSKEELRFNQQQLEEYDVLSIFTTITLFKETQLNYQESGLTIPKMVADLKNNNITGIQTDYKTGAVPSVETILIRS